MKALVTGGAGFIGSHLVELLVSRGDTVTVLDNLSSGVKKNLPILSNNLEFVMGDIRDNHLIEKLVKENDTVFHFAAALGVKNIMANTIESISSNFFGSEIVLNAATKFDKRLIIASTSEIYGKNPIQPLHEESDRVIGAPQFTRWTYSDAKALEEAVALTLHRTQGLKVTIIRFFNTVGPRQTGRYGMVLPRFIQSALKGEDIQVYGDGNQSRVFCHVSDAVDAVIKLEKLESAFGDYFNVGGEGEITIRELAEKVIKKTNSKSRIRFMPYSEVYPFGYQDMLRRVPSLTKIMQICDWKPKNSLDSIIEDICSSL